MKFISITSALMLAANVFADTSSLLTITSTIISSTCRSLSFVWNSNSTSIRALKAAAGSVSTSASTSSEEDSTIYQYIDVTSRATVTFFRTSCALNACVVTTDIRTFTTFTVTVDGVLTTYVNGVPVSTGSVQIAGATAAVASGSINADCTQTGVFNATNRTTTMCTIYCPLTKTSTLAPAPIPSTPVTSVEPSPSSNSKVTAASNGQPTVNVISNIIFTNEPVLSSASSVVTANSVCAGAAARVMPALFALPVIFMFA